ncbi:DoxX family protein [Amorphus sp. 3PC139-8]|uniref:DoxX family protein n=1 Tax=Amorphus sp. 3PC139-8 TaxID=2735676 RepID=UPI00345DF3E9
MTYRAGRVGLAWLLVVFFVIGGIANIFALGGALEEYRRWGYPDWFHYVTGIMELTSAILMALTTTRRIGSALGAVVMVGATLTVLSNSEYLHALLPLIVLFLLCLNFWLWSDRSGRRQS